MINSMVNTKEMRENEIEELFAEFHVSNAEELERKYYEKLSSDKSFYIWGTGKVMQKFLKEFPFIKIAGFIDNVEHSEPIIINGQKYSVFHGTQIEEIKDYIIVASSYYEEIKEQLEKNGKKEFKDFIGWYFLYPRPSELIEKYINNESVTNWKCVNAWTTVRFDRDGFYYSCQCQGWVEFPIGNAFFQTRDTIMNSIIAKLFYMSIETGNYCFCRKERCAELSKNWNNFESGNQLYQCMKQDKDSLAIVGVADFDDSCNLYCASCRDQIITGRDEKKEFLKDYFLNEIMPHMNVINVAGMGEVFFSKYYQEILERCDGIEGIFILSNGMLAKEEKILPISSREGIKGNVAIAVSVDAARAETYEKNRRGGKWSILKKNLQMIGGLVEEGKIRCLTLNFVVSRNNYQEMAEFVQLAQSVKASAVVFTRLYNWGTYEEEEFEKIAMFGKDGRPNKELQREIERVKSLESDVKVFLFDPYGNRRFIYSKLGKK